MCWVKSLLEKRIAWKIQAERIVVRDFEFEIRRYFIMLFAVICQIGWVEWINQSSSAVGAKSLEKQKRNARCDVYEYSY
jgi:hypothetical protein